MRNKKIKNNYYGVSETVGTILMVAITVCLAGTLMVWINSTDTPNKKIHVDLVAELEIQDNGGTINIMHRGGETLSIESIVIYVDIDDSRVELNINDGMNWEEKSIWQVGETWSKDFSYITYSSEVFVLVIDTIGQEILMKGYLQNGLNPFDENSPMITMTWCDPETINIDDDENFTIYALIIDPEDNLINEGVTVNLSPIAGNEVEPMFDYNNNGKYETRTLKIENGILPGNYDFVLTAKDNLDNIAMSNVSLFIDGEYKGTPSNDVGVSLSNCTDVIELNQQYNIDTKIKNFGLNDQYNFKVNCKIIDINGNTKYNEDKIISLLSQNETSVEWKWNTKEIGNYTLIVTTNLINDENNTNNEISKQISVVPFFDDLDTEEYSWEFNGTHPTTLFSEDFEEGNLDNWEVYKSIYYEVEHVETTYTKEFDIANCENPNIIHVSDNVYAIAYEGDGDDGYLTTLEIATNGQLTDSVIDTLEFDIDKGISPDIIHISGNVYVIAYNGKDDDGFLKTVEITNDGQITDTVIDTLEFDTDKCKTPNIIHISSDVYAIAYAGDGDDGFLKTVEITTDGQITDTAIDTLEFDTDNGKTPNIIYTNDDIYAISYSGKDDDGFLKTVEIDTSGLITDTVIDTLEFDTDNGKTPKIIHTNDDICAISYSGKDDDGFLKTVEIDTSGLITDTVIDTLEFDTDNGKTPNIITISNNIYVTAYSGKDDDGFLKTIEIANNGQINDTVIDTLEFDTDNGKTPNIILVSNDIYTIVYSGKDDDGFLKTVDIDTYGKIKVTLIDLLEFDTDNGKTPNIIHISNDVYAIAYSGKDDDGFLKTIKIFNNGSINNIIIDILEFDSDKCKNPDIIHIFANVYAITYSGMDDDGILKTVGITPSGMINDNIIDTLEFDTKKGKTVNIIHINSDVYAIAYTGDGDDGFLKTVEIATNGQISGIIETLEFDTKKGKTPNIIHVSGNIYAIAYTGDGDDGFLKTVEIANDGTITDLVKDTLEFDTVKGKTPNIIHTSNNIFAIVYAGDRDDGFLKTVEIATDGTIIDMVIDTLEFDTNKGKTPNIIHVFGNVYTIAYSGNDDDGFLKTVEINTNGLIRDKVLYALEFDNDNGKEPNLIHIFEDVYIISYSGKDNDGFLKTVNIEVNFDESGVVTISDSEAYSGTNCLKIYGDNENNNEMWIQRSINLEGKSNVYLTWYWYGEDLEENDYAYVSVYDGVWHNDIIKLWDGNDEDHTTIKQDYQEVGNPMIINLDEEYDMINGFKIRFGSWAKHSEQYDCLILDDIKLVEINNGTLWHKVNTRAHSGNISYWSGDDNTNKYTGYMNNSLVSPLINLNEATTAEFSFWHYCDFEGDYKDGGLVEISLNYGGIWTQINPRGGYDGMVNEPSNPIDGRQAFCFDTEGWVQEEFDISDYVGNEIIIRFRFGSSADVNEEGWYIDDVAINWK